MKRTFHCNKKVKFKYGTEETLLVFEEGPDYIITRGNFEHRLLAERAVPMPKALDGEIFTVFGAMVVDTDYTGKQF